jgi:hypothetical protein
VVAKTIRHRHGRGALVLFFRACHGHLDHVGLNHASHRERDTAMNWFHVLIVLAIGYVLGVKFPIIAQKIGLA